MPPTAVAPKGRVLCVDDEPNIVRSLDWLLRGEFDVHTATSAEDALALLRRHDFDVVISDQRMPQVTGVEFLSMVKRIAPRALRILLTGYADTEAMLGSINEAEVFRYVRKPWDTTELPRVVAEAAQIARLQRPRPTEGDVRAAFDAPMLLIDDDAETAELVRELVGAGADLRHARSIGEAAAALRAGDIGIVLSETRIGRSDVAALLQQLRLQHPDVVTVVIAREVDADTVWALINKGQVFRFVPKPLRRDYLAVILQAAQARRRQMIEQA